MAKTVLITGSSSGIGRITAEYFQAMGWNVAATMRSPEKEKELTQLENLKCIRLDVLDQQSIKNAIDETIAAFGDLDVIVNNAGYGTIGPFEVATDEQIKKQFDTNVFGVMNVTRAILPHFRKRKSGTIINVASTGGRMTWPLYSLYHATKWAVEGFSESLQYELRSFGIRIKIIEPGAIRTDFYGRSQEFLDQPGLTAYADYVDTCMPNLQQAGANAPGPEVVADKIYRAATDSSLQIRYQAGRGAFWLMLFRRLLPTRLLMWTTRMVVERKQDRLSKYRDSD